MKINRDNEIRDLDIAVIGMDCRVPGAMNQSEFWSNICSGKESLVSFSDEELRNVGVPEELISNPKYVKKAFKLNDIDMFDANFFGYTPKEATLMDPQQRLLLESAWNALEDAGYKTDDYDNKIGVFLGTGMSHYLLKNIMSNYDLDTSDEIRSIWIGNDSNFASTVISYKLNLTGPSMSIQTACSTSLTAISVACQSLLSYQCDIALAGGCKVAVSQDSGYFYVEGEVGSPDGHCRPFDKDGNGTSGGSGTGVVILKRLEDAIEDNDNIIAVIKGFGINNDGNSKVGYSAPSVEGERKAIQEAQVMSEIDKNTVTYIEAHGTATVLGDPIEIQALNEAYGNHKSEKQYCALGSVKANIGHLDSAAGVAGFIKTCMALKNGMIPPSINYKESNVNILFETTPFYVNTSLKEWKPECGIRRAGVSSFGIGGTNVHVILEEAIEDRVISSKRKLHLLTVSAKTKKALFKIQSQLADFLEKNDNVDFRNALYTMNVGRKSMDYRSSIVCESREECISKLRENKYVTHPKEGLSNKVVFMFPGQGSQYVNMARGLYETEEIFHKEINNCCRILIEYIGFDLREYLYPNSNEDKYQEFLMETEYAHVALFTIEYSIAKLLMHWGIMPSALIGHSIGEYVAACISGVFSLEDALKLIALRGKIMQSMPKGSMLSVTMGEEEAVKYCNSKISLAVVNSDKLVALSGKKEDIEELMDNLNGKKEYRLLHTSHAFHSYMMHGAIDKMLEVFKSITFNEPVIPYMSNVTGKWISSQEATDENYWIKHMIGTVNFKDGAINLGKNDYRYLIEVGPGNTLNTLMKDNLKDFQGCTLLQTIRAFNNDIGDIRFIEDFICKAWSSGIKINFQKFYEGEEYYRVSLPTYPFERKIYWIKERKNKLNHDEVITVLGKCEDEVQFGEAETVYNRPDLSTNYMEASNDLEASIIEILEELTGVHPIGINDNLFELGGHSLMATQVMTRIKEMYSLELPVRLFVEAPTASSLASVIIEVLSKNLDLNEL